jgi:hypothetical protein
VTRYSTLLPARRCLAPYSPDRLLGSLAENATKCRRHTKNHHEQLNSLTLIVDLTGLLLLIIIFTSLLILYKIYFS